MKTKILTTLLFCGAWAVNAQIHVNYEDSFVEFTKKMTPKIPKETLKTTDSIFFFSFAKDTSLIISDDLRKRGGVSAFKDSISIPFKQKEPMKARLFFEEKRLSILKKKSKTSDKDELAKLLRFISAIYQEGLILPENQKAYQELFVKVREKYSSAMFACYKANKCTKGELNELFFFFLEVSPDAQSAENLINFIYPKERSYLLFGKKNNIQIQFLFEYYLSFIYIHQIKGDIDTQTDFIINSFKNISKVDDNSKTWTNYKVQIRKYLSKFDISIQ